MSPRTAMRNEQRASRVKVRGALLALILLENGRQIRARISQLSVNGGLLALERPLDEGIKVTVVFHVGSTSIRSRAEMLFPMWATKGCLQPFRIRDLEDEHRAALLRELERLVNTGAAHEPADASEKTPGTPNEAVVLEETALPTPDQEIANEQPEVAAQEPATLAQGQQSTESFIVEPPIVDSPNVDSPNVDSPMVEPPPESAPASISEAVQSAQE